MTAAQATKLTQRERALAAMTHLAASSGYAQSTVAQIAREAGISRAKFYEEFKDKEDCFIAAQRQLATQLTDEVHDAMRESAAVDTWRATAEALVGFALREPATFNVLTHEAMIAGPRAREERDRLMSQLGETLQEAFAQVPDGAPAPDISSALVIGGVVRLLGVRLRRGEQSSAGLIGDLIEWIDSYSTAARPPRWRDLAAHGAPPIAATVRPSGPPPPRSLPKGRHRLPAETVVQIQRERIVHAAAAAIQGKSYANITVAEIVAAAGISREGFYTHFHDKGEVFAQVRELIFEQMVAATAGAFFEAQSTWPERIWTTQSGFIGFVVTQPSFAYFGFVESYALGPASALRVDEYMIAFTMFLQEGYRQRAEAAPLSRTAGEAIACAVMEIYTYYLRHHPAEDLWKLAAPLAQMVLAPFIGVEEANGFVEGQLRGAS
jgi:AcrR family transcriptional regulator